MRKISWMVYIEGKKTLMTVTAPTRALAVALLEANWLRERSTQIPNFTVRKGSKVG